MRACLVRWLLGAGKGKVHCPCCGRFMGRVKKNLSPGGGKILKGNPFTTVPVSDVVHDALGEFCADGEENAEK
jgi:hypothetical protein